MTPGLSRFTELAARLSMLVSAWSALAAMWLAHPLLIYPIAAAVLAAVSVLAAVPVVSGAGTWRARVVLGAAKVLCCAALVGACISTGALAMGALLVTVLVTQVATTATARDIALGAPVICAMLVQAGMATHGAGGASAFAGSLVALVMSLALVYRCELLGDCDVVVASGKQLVAARPLATVALIGAAVFVLLPDSAYLGVRPASHHHVASTATAAAHTSERTTPDADPGPHSDAIADPAEGLLDLRVRGPLSAVPVFVVSAASPAYWQGAVYDHYDGTAWTTTGAATDGWSVERVAGSAIPVQQAPPDHDRPPGAAIQQRTDDVHVVSQQVLRTVFAPGRAITYTGPGHVRVDADGNPRIDASTAASDGDRDYDVVSTRPVVSSAADAGGLVADARWTQLPPQVPARVKALGVSLAGNAMRRGSPSDAVAAVDAYLKRNEIYDLSAPVPAPGKDAVDEFLFVSHKGFCEQFASAAVVLLRSAGIPARLVTGYSQGDTSSQPGERIMRGSDAHAWVQVWYPGVGWVDDDPTASSVLAGSGVHATQATQPAQPASASVLPRRHRAAGFGRVLAAVPGGGAALVAALVLLAATIRTVTAVYRRRRRTVVTAPTTLDLLAGGPVLQAYGRLENALSALGRERSPGETPRELGARLDGLEVPGGELAMAVELLERECYGIEPLSAAQAASAVAVFDGVAAGVRAMIQRDSVSVMRDSRNS